MTLRLLLDLWFLPFFPYQLLVRPGLLVAVLLTFLRYVLSIIDSFLSVSLLSYPRNFYSILLETNSLLWFPLLSLPNVGIFVPEVLTSG